MSTNPVKYSLVPVDLLPRVLNSLKAGLQPNDKELQLLQTQLNLILNHPDFPDDYKSQQFSNVLLDFLFFKYGSATSQPAITPDTERSRTRGTTSSSELTLGSPPSYTPDVSSPFRTAFATPKQTPTKSISQASSQKRPRRAPQPEWTSGSSERASPTSEVIERGLNGHIARALVSRMPPALQSRGRSLVNLLSSQNDLFYYPATEAIALGNTRPDGSIFNYLEDIVDNNLITDPRAKRIFRELIDRVGGADRSPFKANPYLLAKIAPIAQRGRSTRRKTNLPEIRQTSFGGNQSIINEIEENTANGSRLSSDQSAASPLRRGRPSETSYVLSDSEMEEYNSVPVQRSPYATRSRAWQPA